MLSKDLLNHQLSKDELEKGDTQHLKKVLLLILTDVDFACRKHHVPYYLAYGTLLGAVRHKGYIPWDDDIDISVPLSSFKDFVDAIVSEFGDKYFFGGLYPLESADPNTQMKMMLSGTTFVELQNTNIPFPRGIGIDIFPICSVPKSRFFRKIISKKENFLRHTISVSLEYHYPPKMLLENGNSKIRRYYRFRRFIGFCLSFFSFKKWKMKYIRLLKKTYRNSPYRAFVPSVSSFRASKAFDVYSLQTSEYSFEGHSFLSFADFDTYLKIVYGLDYMTPPPVAERVVHATYSIDFGPY